MKQVLRIGIFSSLLCLGACGSGAVAAIRPQAAKDMSCEEGKLQVRHVRPGASENDGGPYYAEGCGKLWRYVVGCNTGGLCMNPHGIDVQELITRQASFDLTCERQDLTIAELNADTFGVNGCGKKASYLVLCRIDGCKAIQNTQAQ